MKCNVEITILLIFFFGMSDHKTIVNVRELLFIVETVEIK